MPPLAAPERTAEPDALPPDDDAVDDAHVRAERARAEHLRAREAAVDAALDMTFPASDPPAWMP